MSNHYRSEDAQQIQARLYDEAARIYERRTGKRLNRLGGFDPLVYMILGSAASEFEKISIDIHSSWGRMLEQLAHLLTPEVQTGPQPSHGVAHARALDTETFTFCRDQMIAAGHKDRDIFLSPSGEFRISQGDVRYLHLGDSLYEVDDSCFKNLVDKVKVKGISPFDAWIGISLPEDERLEDLHFFWEWEYSRLGIEPTELMLTSRWEHDGKSLEMELGLSPVKNDERTTYSIADEFLAARKVEEEVNRFYNDRFVRLTLPQGGTLKREAFPDELRSLYDPGTSDKMPSNLVWIKVQFSESCFSASHSGQSSISLARELAGQASCLINCFPVINRKVLDRTYSLNPSVNLFELECSGFFHGIESVVSSRLRKEYVQLPFMKILDDDVVENRSYAIRKAGVNRFDERNGTDLLRLFIRFMREESYVFSAMGQGVVSNNIRAIQKALNDLEGKLNRNQGLDKDGKPTGQPPVFIAFPPGESESVIVTYWESEGFRGNFIPSRTPLSLYSDSAWDEKSICLISETLGGHDPHTEMARLHEFKSALITRNRVVTKADIKALCLSELNEELASVEVLPGIEVGSGPKAGLIRVMEVHLHPVGNVEATHWQYLRQKLEKQLNDQAATLVPIRVKVSGVEV